MLSEKSARVADKTVGLMIAFPGVGGVEEQMTTPTITADCKQQSLQLSAILYLY